MRELITTALETAGLVGLAVASGFAAAGLEQIAAGVAAASGVLIVDAYVLERFGR